ncbi:uncharacterized protein BJ171DRAFT_472098 [Polychytrium aggregatum]|uniref:uncharacterized protein n=1 Tax=Polychytrium aggregatum TaxID=110093 RepID=UPI0022FF1417|nr:uncharacterized protein BJ171DRAFT_472098 [Polychytrium aggregatum]KAI9207776.1 hypothetical protein BJ171DRAFT_472098 [Polychytrium aggregatum]
MSALLPATVLSGMMGAWATGRVWESDVSDTSSSSDFAFVTLSANSLSTKCGLQVRNSLPTREARFAEQRHANGSIAPSIKIPARYLWLGFLENRSGRASYLERGRSSNGHSENPPGKAIGSLLRAQY